MLRPLSIQNDGSRPVHARMHASVLSFAVLTRQEGRKEGGKEGRREGKAVRFAVWVERVSEREGGRGEGERLRRSPPPPLS